MVRGVRRRVGRTTRSKPSKCVVDGASQQIEFPLRMDVVRCFQVCAILQRAARGDLIAACAAQVQVFVIGVAFSGEDDVSCRGQRAVVDAFRHPCETPIASSTAFANVGGPANQNTARAEFRA